MSVKIKDGGPAFPRGPDSVSRIAAQQSGLSPDAAVGYSGMTLRDYFAAKTLSSQVGVDVCDIPAAYARFASHCYRMADAMLAAREAKS